MPQKTLLTIELPLRAIPKGRPRFTRSGRPYTPTRTRGYESQIAWYAKMAMGSDPPLTGPIEVTITAAFKRLGKTGDNIKDNEFWFIGSPDIDNLAKAICDAMNNIVYQDDRQICSCHTFKIIGKVDHISIRIGQLLTGQLLTVN